MLNVFARITIWADLKSRSLQVSISVNLNREIHELVVAIIHDTVDAVPSLIDEYIDDLGGLGDYCEHGMGGVRRLFTKTNDGNGCLTPHLTG